MLTQCASCDSHEYLLPFPITADIEDYISCIGKPHYPLSRIKTIKIDNEFVQLWGKVGRTRLRVKFKKDVAKRAFFEMQLAAYISRVMNIKVKTNGLLGTK